MSNLYPLQPRPDERLINRFGSWLDLIWRRFKADSAVAVKTSAYTVENEIQWVRTNCTSGAVTITIPTAISLPGKVIGVIKTDSSSNAVTVSRSSSDTINGATSFSLSRQYQVVFLKSDGISAWDVINAGIFNSVDATTVNIDGGTIDGTVIGGASAAAGTFTTVLASTAGNSARFVNTTDQVSNQGVRIESDRANPANNDIVYASFMLSDSGGTQTEFARVQVQALDVTNTSEDGRLDIVLIVAGALSTRYNFNATSFQPNASDGAALGTSATNWADLFLSSGGVINWNSGNYTVTHSAGLLTTNGALTLGGAITTSAPSGGTAAAWKLGTVSATSPTAPNRTIELDVGGTIYYLHAKTTND